MKTLSYFEKQADALRETAIDYRLVSKKDLVLTLMKKHRHDHGISWTEYKKVYDKWFGKYC